MNARRRSGRAMVGCAAVAFASGLRAVAGAQTPTPRDVTPTIAVMDFVGGAIGRSDADMLGVGITELLSTALAGSHDIRIVERTRFHDIVQDMKLSISDSTGDEAGMRAARALGANYFIAGGFLVMPNDHIRIDARAIRVETTDVMHEETVEGDAKNLFALVDDLANQLRRRLRLPPSRPVTVARIPDRVDQARAVAALGRAVSAAGRRDTASAIVAAREALVAHPGFEAARALLSALETGKSPH